MLASVVNTPKPLSRKLVLILVLALAASATILHAGMPRGQKHEGRHKIDQLEEVWRQAVLKSDAVAMAALLDDDYIGITAKGMLLTKEETLAKIGSGRALYTSLELSDRKVRFYGGTALVTSLAQATGTNAEGEDISGSFRYTRVYVRNAQGAWKIVSFEASRIHEPGDRRGAR
jgi:ketosteroid isomerase-like protein